VLFFIFYSKEEVTLGERLRRDKEIKVLVPAFKFSYAEAWFI
jgi:hypothetical protein